MEKLKLIHLVIAFLIISSCSQKQDTMIENHKIANRNFNFQNNNVNRFAQRIKVMKNDDYKLFVYYKSEGFNDSLKILKNGKIYFRNKLLKRIDLKSIKTKNSYLTISKCYFEDPRDYRGNCNLFITIDSGLIFFESLNSGTMTEYNTEKFKIVHKAIALRQLGFKDGKFELKYARRNYPELKE